MNTKSSGIFKNEFFHKSNAMSYIIALLIVSWIVEIILFINPEIGQKYFSLVMFLPAIMVIVMNRVQHNNKSLKLKNILVNINVKSVLFSILYPIVFIVLCAAIVDITGLGDINFSKLSSINIMLIINNIIVGLFGALGEEYGWRGYLLPELTKTKGKIKSTIIVGIVWALYHAPIVFLLAKTTGLEHPFFVCIIQLSVAFVFSFSFSYCYFLSGSLLPVIIYHSFWNTINPAILGNIYTNKPGIVSGDLMYINGEGLIGLVLGTLFIFWFVKQFKKENYVGSANLVNEK